MKLTFYGTAAAEGFPALFCECDSCTKARKLKGKNFRTRSQSLVNDDLLIDYPADTYLHVLNHGLQLHKIQHIIITHSHSDHLYVEDIVMRKPGFSNLKNPLPLNIYGSSIVIEKLLANNNIKEMTDNNILVLNKMTAFNPVKIKDYKVTPLEADHQSAKEPFIYLIEQQGKTILYAHDTGYFPDSTMEYLEKTKPNINFATFDCCYSLRHKDKGHMGFDEVLTMKERLEKIGVINKDTMCCVNHFSHNNGELYKDMSKHSKKYGFITSYDGLEKEF